MNKCWSKKKKNKVLFAECQKYYNDQEDVIIFACETMSVKNKGGRIIGIQHGITWDVKGHENYSHWKNSLFIFWRAVKAYKTIQRITNLKMLVCVDYNFLNWYRTQVAYTEVSTIVIPNSTQIMEITKEKSDVIKIIFARRFQKYRGTRLFARIAQRIINEFEHIQITFAGGGPDEVYLKDLLGKHPRVNFTTYDSEKSIDIHSQYQIAVIPTIGSEGTSLSMLEAMASMCAVVATNVGGMTNVIIDNFNGLLVNPDDEQLYSALVKLITNQELREKLSINAYHTVAEGFNFNLWKEKWQSVLQDTKIYPERKKATV